MRATLRGSPQHGIAAKDAQSNGKWLDLVIGWLETIARNSISARSLSCLSLSFDGNLQVIDVDIVDFNFLERVVLFIVEIQLGKPVVALVRLGSGIGAL